MNWQIGDTVQAAKGKAIAISQTETHMTFQYNDGSTFDMPCSQEKRTDPNSIRKHYRRTKTPKTPKTEKIVTEEDELAKLEATIAAAKEKLGIVQKIKKPSVAITL